MIIPVKLDIKKILMGMLLGVVILVLVALVFVLTYIRNFSRSAGISAPELVSLVKTGVHNKDQFTNQNITFLFLGLDKRDDELEKTLLTDTMMIGSLNTGTGKLTTISLPRDLWIPDLSTKINSLYFYGEKNPETNGVDFTASEVEKITGVKPAFIAVLNYLELPAFIDLVGGVEVAVEKSFEDNEYPNPAYVVGQGGTPYITVRFDQGAEIMDGDRALSYIRSRGSADPEEGSDIARSKRQMIVLSALFKKLKSKEVVQNPETMGKLYRFWKEKVKTTLTDEDAIGMGMALGQNPVSIISVGIPVVSTPTQDVILVNPPISKYGLWVWEARDKSWKELKEFVKNNL